MSRTRKTERRGARRIGPRIGWLPALASAALGLAPVAARAASYTYGTQQRTVNAGVLVVGAASDTVSAAPDSVPYVFETLNLRADIKPFGWNIINPRAPGTVTGAIQTRWNGFTVLAPPAPGSRVPAYSLGQAVDPTMAAYWEVPLRDTAADQLRQYDILYVDATGVKFTPADNAKLRRFVDGGGQLWVEYRNTGGTGNSGLFTGTQWTAGAAGALLGLPADGSVFLRHPLLSQPFLFSAQDFANFGLPAGAGTITTFSTSDASNLFGDAFDLGAAATAKAGQYGAGQVVVDAAGIGATLSPSTINSSGSVGPDGAYYTTLLGTPPTPEIVPTPDLKFLANLVSFSETHPGENKNSHGDAANSDVASFAPAWTAPAAASLAPLPPNGAAVWGNFVFVTDSAGTLHTYDAYPAEDLTGTGKPDDGSIIDFGGTSTAPPTEYDEIWNASAPGGASALGSAPTLATYGGQTFVLVEGHDGKVYRFDAVTGLSPMTLPNSGSAAGNAPSNYVPGPTYYMGRVYAAQPDGTLYVYDFNAGGAAHAGIHAPLGPVPAGTSTEIGGATPTVGLLADGPVTSDVVALVPTNENLYTVFLGARADPLQPVPPGTTPPTGYNVNRQHLGYLPVQIDQNANPSPQAYTLDGTGQALHTNGGPSGSPAGTGQDFSNPTAVGTYYGDYDQDLTLFTQGGTQAGQADYLTQISGSSFGAAQSGSPLTNCVFSAAAFDRRGDYYYTETNTDGSYLVGVHGDAQVRNVRIKFRFRMPRASDLPLNDPDGILWANLVGYSFVGPPVIDAQGRVCAAASSGTNAAVLCFDANGEIYADAPAAFDPSQATLFQNDESPAASQPNQLRPGGEISGNPNAPLLRYGEYNASGSRVSFFNFGVGTGSQRQLAGNLSEPQIITAQPNVDANNPAQQSTPVTLNLHTNLLWYAQFPVSGAITGLSKAGGTLFLADSGVAATTVAPITPAKQNTLYALSSAPALGPGKVATSPITPLALPAYIGTVLAAPSIGGSVMTVTGTNGTATLTRQFTLIADNNRILEADTQGNAVWATDATTAANGTKTDFSHPTALAQVSPNDYLVADTGNNRCVRFDRAGNTTWELTAFTDPTGILKVGQPLSLNQPSSVQIRTAPDTSGSVTNPGGTRISYLIADSGNNRVVEVTDVLDAAGHVTPTGSHILTWASHTADQGGRAYRFGSATYYGAGGGTPTFIAAAVTNTRIAPLAAGGVLSPASGDAPGGSIVLFKFVKAATFFGVYNSFMVPDAAGKATPALAIRNPRYLTAHTPVNGAIPIFLYTDDNGTPVNGVIPSFLYADDNGAFDLDYDAINKLFVVGDLDATPSDPTYGLYINVGLHFTKAAYQTMTLPAVGITGMTYSRKDIPFVPTCIQRLDSGSANPRYLITQGHSQSELGTDPSRIGGEVFEVDGHTDPRDPKYGTNTAVGGFGGATLSRPGLTGPLTQPTSAIRPQ